MDYNLKQTRSISTDLESIAEKEGSTFHQVSNGTTVEWKIENFLDHKHSYAAKLKSREFRESDIYWQISLYPFGKNRNCSGYISLFLGNTTVGASPFRTSVEFSLKVGDILLSSKKFNFTFKSFELCGSLKFLERSVLLNCLKPASSCSTLTVVCTICSRDLFTSKPATSLDEGAKTLANNLKELYLRKEFYDIKIKVGPEEFQAHKLFLAARSPIFASMLHHEMAGSISGTIEISDCDPKDFEDFLRLLYTWNAKKLGYKKALSLYKIADKYSVQDLKELCQARIFKLMKIDSVCEVLELAATFEVSELLETATEFFISNADKILETKRWQDFLSERSALANKFLTLLAKGS